MSRIAVLASGRGSNLQALHAYLECTAGRERAAEIALVASDRADAGALAFAREHGIGAAVLEQRGADAHALEALLREHRIELVVLAGYLRLIPAEVVRAFRGKIINIHPALLPAFGGPGMYGERVHRAVLASGAWVTGATVHFVDEVYDRGATIAQWPVPVFSDDTVSTLAARVLRVEHLLLPRAVAAVAAGRIWLDQEGRATGAVRGAHPEAAFISHPVEDSDLARAISAALAL
jgi:formyltetrahydrofolate-dependent phosphoribosylglycinamide formyltransferase